MSQDQLNRAIGLIQSGKKEDAREILLELVELEPYHVSVWMWLAEAMPDDGQRIEVIQACLKLNPDSMMAKRGLQRFLESQKLRRRSSIGNAPTVPLPSPSSPANPASFPGQPVAKTDNGQVEEPIRFRPPKIEPFIKSVNPQQEENIPAFRDAMLGNKKLPIVEPWSAIADKLKPTTSEVGKRPSISQKGAEHRSNLRGSPLSRRKNKATSIVGKRGINRWVILGILGVMAVVVIAAGFLLREPIRDLLGLRVPTATPIQNAFDQPTSGSLETEPVTQGTQVQTPGAMSTLIIFPTQTITINVAYSFPNPVLVPGMDEQIDKLAELSAPPAQSLAFSPDNRLLAAGMQDGTVFIWDLSTRNVVQIFKGHTLAVNAVAFSPDARYIVSGSEDGTAQAWKIDTLQLIHKVTNHQKAITSVAFSPNGIIYALGSLDGTIDLWNVGAQEPTGTIVADSGVTSLGFSPGGEWLAYGTNSGEINLWNTLTNIEMKTTQVHTDAVTGLQFSPNGGQFASGSADKSVKLWDTASGKILYTVGSHTESVESVSFSPDGRLLASAELGHTVKIWDIANRLEVESLRHAQRMLGTAFSPDGRILASTLLPIDSNPEEGGVVFWGVASSPDIIKSPARLDMDSLKAGNWSTGGSMLLARSAHKMVEVRSGQLLIIDGLLQASQANDPDIMAHQAEVYSISEGTSSFTSPMNIGLGAPNATSATLLWDGRVLVISDSSTGQAGNASVEIYDPASGTWSSTDPLINHGGMHTATLLSDGRLLVVGGCTEDGFSGHAELFEPTTNTWTETASLPQPRCGHTSTLLTNGHVLIAGGYGSDGEYLTTALLYNPNINQWVAVGSMTTARTEASAMLLTNGRVLVAGGLARSSGSTITIKSVEIYDPDSGAWESAEPMAQSRYGHSITRLSSGLVMAVGGVQITPDGTKLYLGDVEVYDPVSGSWTTIAPLQMPRAFPAALFLSDGRLVVLGGMNSQGVPQAGSEIFMPK